MNDTPCEVMLKTINRTIFQRSHIDFLDRFVGEDVGLQWFEDYHHMKRAKKKIPIDHTKCPKYTKFITCPAPIY
jgi:hypothetical protein